MLPLPQRCTLLAHEKTTLPSSLKEYAQAEGVSAKLGVASESVVDLSCRNRVPETMEYCEKVPLSSVRPHVDLVPGGMGLACV